MNNKENTTITEKEIQQVIEEITQLLSTIPHGRRKPESIAKGFLSDIKENLTKEEYYFQLINKKQYIENLLPAFQAMEEMKRACIKKYMKIPC